MFKQTVNFRLHPHVLSLLAELAVEQHLSRTAVVEAAIKAYAQHQLPEHSLMHFAGSLSASEADTWLSTIQHARQNKKPTEF